MSVNVVEVEGLLKEKAVTVPLWDVLIIQNVMSHILFQEIQGFSKQNVRNADFQ